MTRVFQTFSLCHHLKYTGYINKIWHGLFSSQLQSVVNISCRSVENFVHHNKMKKYYLKPYARFVTVKCNLIKQLIPTQSCSQIVRQISARGLILWGPRTSKWKPFFETCFSPWKKTWILPKFGANWPNFYVKLESAKGPTPILVNPAGSK